MIKKIKKTRGFTLVELIVVIAIVTILAAVGVASYLVFIGQGNESADIQLVTQLNKVLKADEINSGVKETFYEVNTEILEVNGFKSYEITAKSSNNYIVWDQENNRFALVNKESNEVVFTDEDITFQQSQIKQKNNYQKSYKYNKWVVAVNQEYALAASKKGYAVYLGDNYVGASTLDIYSSFDCGKIGTDQLNSVIYHENEFAQKVLVRTNGGEFVIDSYFDDQNGNVDEFIHFGVCESLDIPDEVSENFTEKGTSTEAIKLEKKLTNTSFLYRLGNKNSISLNQLFNNTSSNSLSGEDADLTIDVKDGNVTCTFTKNVNDILASTIKFEKEGIIELNFRYKSKTFTQNFEICDGYNCLNYSELKTGVNSKSILLNDIKMSNGGQLYLDIGASIDGNGFTFDVRDAATSHSKHNESNSHVIALKGNNILDNIKIIGKPYNNVSLTAAAENNFPVVSVLGDDNVIANSFIANCCAPVRMRGGKLTIKNTTLSGGSFCNLDIRNGDVILEDLTTINQTGYSEGALGLGITSYYENVISCNILIKGSLNQYNWVSSEDSSKMNDDHQKQALNEILKTSPYNFEKNGIKYANCGILAMNTNTSINDNGLNKELYLSKNISFNKVDGEIYSVTGSTPISYPSQYVSNNNLANAPRYSFELPKTSANKNYVSADDNKGPFCTYDDTLNAINIGFPNGGSFTFDLDILNIQKFEHVINPEKVTIIKDLETIEEINSITSYVFNKQGKFSLVYSYKDPYNYEDNLESYEITYSVSIDVSVIEISEQNEAVISLYDKENELIDLGNKTFLLNPKADDDTRFRKYTYQGHQINVPFYDCKAYASDSNQNKDVTGQKVSTKYLWHEVLGGFAKITDYTSDNTPIDVSGTTNNEDPDNFKFLTSSSNNDPKSVFNWQSGTYEYTKKSLNGKLYYISPDGSTNLRKEGDFTVIYSYKSNLLNTFLYGVHYHSTACEENCFTPDTKITLANGTQKEIQYITKEDKILSYDMYQGKFVSSNIIGLINHGYATYNLLKCNFSNGETFKILEKHGLYDYDLNAFIYIEPSNYESYLGHRFVAYNGNKTSYDIVTLDSVELSKEYTCAYSIASYQNMSAVTENILSVTPNIDAMFWIPKKDKLLYDTDALNEIINQYGTYDYSLFKDYLTYDQFIGFNGPLLKAPVEMGLLTFDDLIRMIEENKEYIV